MFIIKCPLFDTFPCTVTRYYVSMTQNVNICECLVFWLLQYLAHWLFTPFYGYGKQAFKNSLGYLFNDVTCFRLYAMTSQAIPYHFVQINK